jgi:hypothetical protein
MWLPTGKARGTAEVQASPAQPSAGTPLFPGPSPGIAMRRLSIQRGILNSFTLRLGKIRQKKPSKPETSGSSRRLPDLSFFFQPKIESILLGISVQHRFYMIWIIKNIP